MKQLLVFTTFAVTSAAAFADAGVSLSIHPMPGVATGTSLRHPVGLGLTYSVPDGSASGVADLSAGVLQALVQPVSTGAVFSVNTNIAERISFANGFGQIGYIDWHVSAEQAFGGYQADFRFGNSSEGVDMRLASACAPEWTNCYAGRDLDFSGSLAFTITQDTYVYSSIVLYMAGYAGLVASEVSLRLPAGVTFTSPLGYPSFSGVSTIPAVPEPSTVVLLGIGLLLIGGARVRKLEAARRRGE